MMSSPSVSIVIPCFNAGPFLAETIESALKQTYPPVEVIVVDDGSRDNSVEVAESFGLPVRVVRQANQGVSVARNRGAELASGSHLLFLDADDLLAEESLERLVKAIEGPRDVPVMGYRVFRDGREKILKESMPHADTFFPQAFVSHISHVGSWLVPREVMAQTGGFLPGLRNGEDWLFAAQLGFTGARMRTVPYFGYWYRKHAESQTATAKELDRQSDRLKVMTKVCEMLRGCPEIVESCGKEGFWAMWASIRAARREGVAWREVGPLAAEMRQLLKEHPRLARSSWTAATVRLVGAYWASCLRSHVRFNPKLAG